MAPWGVNRLRWRVQEILQMLWVRVTSFALLGLVTAGLGFVVRDRIPDELAGRIGAEAIEPILSIVASSMLTVTTFSLSILTAAYATASSGSTPRAVRLLVRDGVSQTVLATFMGAFVFSLVGLIMLNTQVYGGGGRVVLFVVTVAVLIIVILSLLRWIERLGELGLIGDNLARVEEATAKALQQRLASPWLGANPLRGAPPAEATAIMAPKVGYVQNCDMQTLADLADKNHLILYVTATPGDLVHPAQSLVHALNLDADDDSLRRALIECFTLRPTRTFEQDPRFGFQVLSEIGQRALSPAVNDPGTAIAVTVRITAILSVWTHEMSPEVRFPRLHIRSITPDEIVRDSLLPLARDGAGTAELHHALYDCLTALIGMAPRVFAPVASDLAGQFQAYSSQAIVLKQENSELDQCAQRICEAAGRVVPLGTRNNL